VSGSETAALPADCTYGNPECEVCPRKAPPPATPTEENENE